MEKLIQKYARWFDTAMIAIILLQLVGAVIIILTKCIHCEAVVSVVLSVINLMLLSNSLRCNRTQQFVEWKVNAKILRYTLGLFILFHMVVFIMRGFNMIELGSHLLLIDMLRKGEVNKMPSVDITNLITVIVALFGGGVVGVVIKALTEKKKLNAEANNTNIKSLLEIDQRMNERMTKLEERVANLEQENYKLKSEKLSLEKETHKLKLNIIELEEKNKKLEDENKSLQEEIDNIKKGENANG